MTINRVLWWVGLPIRAPLALLVLVVLAFCEADWQMAKNEAHSLLMGHP